VLSHRQVADKRLLYHNAAHNPRPPEGGGGAGAHPSWAANSANDIAWAREYPDGFEI
jgi:hypothetical protein